MLLNFLKECFHRKNLNKIENNRITIGNNTFFEFNQRCCRVIGELSNSLRKKGQRIGEYDIVIGGIAMENNETLVTRNVKHFRKIKGLKIETW